MNKLFIILFVMVSLAFSKDTLKMNTGKYYVKDKGTHLWDGQYLYIDRKSIWSGMSDLFYGSPVPRDVGYLDVDTLYDKTVLYLDTLGYFTHPATLRKIGRMLSLEFYNVIFSYKPYSLPVVDTTKKQEDSIVYIGNYFRDTTRQDSIVGSLPYSLLYLGYFDSVNITGIYIKRKWRSTNFVNVGYIPFNGNPFVVTSISVRSDGRIYDQKGKQIGVIHINSSEGKFKLNQIGATSIHPNHTIKYKINKDYGDKKYNIFGQQITSNKTGKGIYIVKNKKIVVK